MTRAEAGRPEPIVDLIDELRANGVRAVSPNGVLGDPRSRDRQSRQGTADAADHRPRRGRRRMASMTTSFRLDGSYRRYDRVVIAGSPLRLFRLSPAGQRVVEAIEQKQPLPSGHSQVDRSARRCRRHSSDPHRVDVHRQPTSRSWCRHSTSSRARSDMTAT